MTYVVDVTREEGMWLADVPEVAGAHTFARSLTGLEKAVREVIVLMDDLDDNAEVAMRLVFDVDDAVVGSALRLGAERRELSRREADLQQETAAAVVSLTKNGYSVRDAAVLLGVTPGRVSQLANA